MCTNSCEVNFFASHDDVTCIAFFPSTRIESSGHGEAEMKDVRVEKVELLSQKHGEGLVAAICFHLVPVAKKVEK